LIFSFLILKWVHISNQKIFTRCWQFLIFSFEIFYILYIWKQNIYSSFFMKNYLGFPLRIFIVSSVSLYNCLSPLYLYLSQTYPKICLHAWLLTHPPARATLSPLPLYNPCCSWSFWIAQFFSDLGKDLG
jgi:hypothetical protein